MHTPRSSGSSRHAHTSRAVERRDVRGSSQPAEYAGGRHELGQNFLVDERVIARVVDLVSSSSGPIVELGAGGGALTRPLADLGRSLTALELDPRRVAALGLELEAGGSAPRERPTRARGREHAPRYDRAKPGPRVVHADALTWSFPTSPHVIVGNVPFHLTTTILKRLLGERHWTDAVLLTQWEVARRRCGVGGTSQLTVQWMPWFEFTLDRRVPARAFRPTPAVDGGLFTVRRRPEPLVPDRDRRAYQAYVAAIFSGRGRGLAQILARTSRPLHDARCWLAARDLPPDALPRHLSADDWADLWKAVHGRR